MVEDAIFYLDIVMPFFDLELSKSSCSRALAAACGAHVTVYRFHQSVCLSVKHLYQTRSSS